MWLGYSGLMVDCSAISAVLHYRPAWDRRIVQSYGSLPAGVCGIVLLEDGRVLPARRSVDDLRRQWSTWQAQRGS